jgi:hypothetical protein
MKVSINIERFSTVQDLPGFWTNADYRALLNEFNFPDADQISDGDLLDMLKMAISDFDPVEAAEIILTYKMTGKLTNGQIKQVAYDMRTEPMAEEYPDITLHDDFFHINRLLYKSYNGKFPAIKLTLIKCQVQLPEGVELTKEILLKAFSHGLSSRNVIRRLYDNELHGKKEFAEAEHIIWKMDNNKESGECNIITSDYWMNQEDFEYVEFDTEVKMFEAH